MADRQIPVTQLDHQYRAQAGDGMRQMPDKVRGKHRWVVTAMFTTTSGKLKANERGEDDILLDGENLVYMAVGCVDCVQPWPSPEPCAAGDEWGRRG